MEQADLHLARAWARTGDASAFDELYRRYADKVYAFARHLSGSDAVAEDMVQETFMRAARAMDSYNNHAAFTTWLLTIARNAYRDFGRKQARRARDRDLPLPVRDSQEPAVATESREMQSAVRAAVLRLPEAQRIAVTLCNLQEMPQKHAAVVLGWRIEKLKSTLHRARQRLKQELAQYME